MKIKSPDVSSSTITPPATTSTPINWASNKWNDRKLQISPGGIFT